MSNPVPAMSDVVPAVELVQGHPVVLSTKIAEHFEKPHYNVLKAINALILEDKTCGVYFYATSIQVPMPTGGHRKSPAYHLTRDGFTLLAMGFTGKKALAWKIRYIEAFNAMEAKLAGKPDDWKQVEKLHTRTRKGSEFTTVSDRRPIALLIEVWVRNRCGNRQPKPVDFKVAWKLLCEVLGIPHIDRLRLGDVPWCVNFLKQRIDESAHAKRSAKASPAPWDDIYIQYVENLPERIQAQHYSFERYRDLFNEIQTLRERLNSLTGEKTTGCNRDEGDVISFFVHMEHMMRIFPRILSSVLEMHRERLNLSTQLELAKKAIGCGPRASLAEK